MCVFVAMCVVYMCMYVLSSPLNPRPPAFATLCLMVPGFNDLPDRVLVSA